MPASVTRLTERTLDIVFGRTPWMLLLVDRLPNASMHRALPDLLDFRFPGLFTFATVARGDFSPARLGELLQSAVGRLRGGVTDGYYLLEAGLVVGHHRGAILPDNVSYGQEAEAEAQRARIRAMPPGVSLTGRDLEAARQLMAYFEPIVERKQRAAGFGADGTSSGGETVIGADGYTRSSGPTYADAGSFGGYGGTAPPAPARTDDPDDPYTVLGIAPGATQDQIKAAYREQLKLNHPDKVAHLSPALQQFAAQQTLKVKAAYERLSGRR
ncbi:MAG: J domain-containing protein [Myxococcota bacterium]